jgi:hypothetical protein
MRAIEKVIPDIDRLVTLYTAKGTISPHRLQRPSRRYRLPATPTILFVDGSNDHAVVVRVAALGSMAYLSRVSSHSQTVTARSQRPAGIVT